MHFLLQLLDDVAGIATVALDVGPNTFFNPVTFDDLTLAPSVFGTA